MLRQKLATIGRCCAVQLRVAWQLPRPERGDDDEMSLLAAIRAQEAGLLALAASCAFSQRQHHGGSITAAASQRQLDVGIGVVLMMRSIRSRIMMIVAVAVTIAVARATKCCSTVQ